MQVPGIKVTIGAGAAVVFAAVYAWLSGDTSKVDAQLARASNFAQSVPVAAWLFVPLALTLIAATAARFGFLQKLFGDLYKQLTDSHNQTGKRLKDRDEQRLRHMLQGWKSPMPYLKRADGWLALWSGRERWSLAGFDRCWLIALVYPIAVLLLVWALTNNGRLGAATVLPSVNEDWRRWAAVLAISVSCAVTFCGALLSRRVAHLRRRLMPSGRFGARWMQLSDAELGDVVFAVALAGASIGGIAIAITGVGARESIWFFAIGGSFAGAFVATGAITAAQAIAAAAAGAIIVGSGVSLISPVTTDASRLSSVLAGSAALMWLFCARDERTRAYFVTHATPNVLRVCAIVTIYATLFAATIVLLPQFPHWDIALRKNALSVRSAAFVLLTLIGVFPLLNAISDWVSLNATRTFIARMQTGATRGVVARLYVWDIAVALLLTLFVYGTTIGILLTMQRAGWEVDVKSILAELRDNPWSGQSTWLLALAVTNFIPTLVHMVLWLSDGLQSRDAETREDIEQFLRSGGKDAALQIAPTIIYVLRIQKWLERAMVLSLTLALIPLFAICVPWAAGQMLRLA